MNMKWLFILCLGVIFFLSKGLLAGEWKEFNKDTSFRVLFPAQPNHLHNELAIAESEQGLQYDLYIAGKAQESLYMMLVAEFPKELNENQEMLSIEGFMKGILKDKAESKLVFVDSLKVQGHPAMDFLMKSRQDHFFKGRVIAAAKKLYLLTVEYSLENFNEKEYQTFMDSFHLAF